MQKKKVRFIPIKFYHKGQCGSVGEKVLTTQGFGFNPLTPQNKEKSKQLTVAILNCQFKLFTIQTNSLSYILTLIWSTAILCFQMEVGGEGKGRASVGGQNMLKLYTFKGIWKKNYFVFNSSLRIQKVSLRCELWEKHLFWGSRHASLSSLTAYFRSATKPVT